MNDKKKYIYIAIGLLLAICAGYYLFSCDKVDNGAGVDQIGTNIRQAGEQLNDAGSAIKSAKDTAAELESSVDKSRELNSSSAALIAEGKQILRAVRERGAKD